MNWQSDFLSSPNNKNTTNNNNNNASPMNNNNSNINQQQHYVSKSTITLSSPIQHQLNNHYNHNSNYHTSPPKVYAHSNSSTIIDYSASNINNNNNNNNNIINNGTNLANSSSSSVTSNEFLANNNPNMNLNLYISNNNNLNLTSQSQSSGGQQNYQNNSSPTTQLIPNKQLVPQIIDLIRHLNIKLLAFDFDCTIVTIHTGGQWLDSAEKLAEFVRPCFRELLPALLKTPDLYVCVVTYSPQEQLIREVLRISMKDELAVNDLVSKIVIKGNTKEFLQQYGIENCFSQGKQIHLKYCRNYFESANNNNNVNTSQLKHNNSNNSLNNMTKNDNVIAKSNKENIVINDSNILLIDDDVQNLKLAYENGHLVFQVNNTMKLADFYNYLKERRPILI